jgi:hypothetical protein
VTIHTRITVGGTYNGYSGSPAATDDILPLGTQQGPGATRLINVSPQANISHPEAYDAIEPMLREFRNVFENHFGVTRRNTSGGGYEPPPCEPIPPHVECAV